MIKKIRILKNDKKVDYGTFLNEMDPQSIQTVNDPKNNSIEQMDDGEPNDKYKKKKVMNKNNVSNRGLKYLNPSQRNHSSVYE
ncbi:MAG TPA: hypothetical protein VFG45_04170 [Candidatus Nitrosocosmicus sp.]|nr:hypothetical protein [Candidatus Nitrosocosmicus sp.]